MSSLETIRQLREILIQMLPRGTGIAVDWITDQEASIEYPEEAQQVANAVQKRRNEFFTGRRCARVALKQIGVEPCALIASEGRIPKWPTGMIGSISHSIRLCCAIAARSEDMPYLGVDLETTTRISSGVIERVTHPLERDFVNGDQELGSLIFSVKEAFFKAQFPKWKAWPNFGDLAFRVDAASDRLEVLEVAPHLPAKLRAVIERMQFRYAFLGEYVLTLCWLRNV